LYAHIEDKHIFGVGVTIQLLETRIEVSMRLASPSQYFPTLILFVCYRRESFLECTEVAHVPVSKLGYPTYSGGTELR